MHACVGGNFICNIAMYYSKILYVDLNTYS